MHLHVLTINETTGVVSNTATGDVLSELEMINGDTNLINAHIVRNVTSETPVDKNLSTVTSLRCMIESARREGAGADIWAFQDVINQGYDSALTENLPTGFVTWAVALNDSDLTTALSTTEESVAGFIEWTYIDSNAHPKTIAQLDVTIFAQLDDGAAGTPPPSSPTYYTAAEIDTLIVRGHFTTAQNLKTPASHTIYTVPSGKRLLINRAGIICDAVSSAANGPVVGFFADSTRITADVQFDELNVANGMITEDLSGAVLAAGEIIKATIATGSTASSHTGRFVVQGFLIDDA